MNPVAHHLPQDLMLLYAAGSCDRAEALFTASHLTLCAACRAEVACLEAVGGSLLEDIEHTHVSGGLLARTVALLDEPPLPPAEASPVSDGVLPAALMEHVGALKDIDWTTKLFGAVKYLELPLEHNGVPLRLKRIRRGQSVPEHSHRALELELYLVGGATDPGTGKSYRRGDVSIYEAGELHRLEVDRGEDCVLLCMDGRLVGTDLRSRLLYGFLGWT